MRPSEFQGVILCGPGTELYPLTQHTGSVYKALLPVCNQPLLDSPLRLLESLGLNDILVLCQSQREADDISSWTRKRSSSSSTSTARVEVWATDPASSPGPAGATASSQIPKRHGLLNGHIDTSHLDSARSEPQSDEDSDEDDQGADAERAAANSETQGTAGALRWAASQGLLKRDFVLLPCDLHLNADHVESVTGALLDRHRRDDCLLSTLLIEAPEDSKAKDATVLTMMEPTKSLLLDLKEMADFNAEDDIELRPTHYPRTKITTTLSQSHLYICSKRVLTLLQALPHQLQSFKDDLVPFLAKCQWQKALLTKYNLPLPEQHPQQMALLHSSLSYPLTDDHGPAAPNASSTAQTPSLAASQTFDHAVAAAAGPSYKKDEAVVCHIWKRSQGCCLRANTVETYAELNRALLPAHAHKSQHPFARQVGTDSLVGPNLVLGEKSTVKRSVLGKGIHVGAQTKISNCILMDHVVLGDNVKLESCIVAANARIEADVSLIKCEVGSGVEVFAGANAKGEKLAALGE